MNLYTLSHRNQSITEIFQVIAKNENQARLLLIADGITFADNPNLYEVETVYELSPLYDGHPRIDFNLEVENENYKG